MDGAATKNSDHAAQGVGTVSASASPRALSETVDQIYRAGVAGVACWARNRRGDRHDLPIDRWMGHHRTGADDRLIDEHVLAQCSAQPTLDLGCGPGRFTTALHRRGHAALGVDMSLAAVEMTRARGGAAIRTDLFAPLPAEGCWDQVLLTDGNIGIGGDPARTLRRAARLLAPGGVVIADLDPSAAGVWHEVLRWETSQHVGPWFSWSRVGTDAIGGLADAAGLAVGSMIEVCSRVIAILPRLDDQPC